MEPPIKAEALHSQYKKLQPEDMVAENHPSDLAYFDMRGTDGWKNLRGDIEGHIDNLDKNMNVSDHDTAETIALKYLATQTAKAYLQAVLDTVETSYEHIRDQTD